MSKKIYVLLAVCIVILLGLLGLSLSGRLAGSEMTSADRQETFDESTKEEIKDDSISNKAETENNEIIDQNDIENTAGDIISDSESVAGDDNNVSEDSYVSTESNQAMDVVEEFDVELEEGEAGGAM